MRFAWIICALILCSACHSPTKEIAEAAVAARADLGAIQDDQVSALQHVRDMISIAGPCLPPECKEPFIKASGSALKDLGDMEPHADALETHIDRISTRVTETHDNESQWFQALKWGVGGLICIVIIAAIVYFKVKP